MNRAREAAERTRGLSKDDVEELKRLRAENAELRMERDVNRPGFPGGWLFRRPPGRGSPA